MNKNKNIKYISGIEIRCPHCNKLVRIELGKPIKKQKAPNFFKSVEKVYVYNAS